MTVLPYIQTATTSDRVLVAATGSGGTVIGARPCLTYPSGAHMLNRTIRPTRRRGYTLIELAIGMTVFLAVAGLVTVAVVSSIARQGEARAVRELSGALDGLLEQVVVQPYPTLVDSSFTRPEVCQQEAASSCVRLGGNLYPVTWTVVVDDGDSVHIDAADAVEITASVSRGSTEVTRSRRVEAVHAGWSPQRAALLAITDTALTERLYLVDGSGSLVAGTSAHLGVFSFVFDAELCDQGCSLALDPSGSAISDGVSLDPASAAANVVVTPGGVTRTGVGLRQVGMLELTLRALSSSGYVTVEAPERASVCLWVSFEDTGGVQSHPYCNDGDGVIRISTFEEATGRTVAVPTGSPLRFGATRPDGGCPSIGQQRLFTTDGWIDGGGVCATWTFGSPDLVRIGGDETTLEQARARMSDQDEIELWWTSPGPAVTSGSGFAAPRLRPDCADEGCGADIDIPTACDGQSCETQPTRLHVSEQLHPGLGTSVRLADGTHRIDLQVTGPGPVEVRVGDVPARGDLELYTATSGASDGTVDATFSPDANGAVNIVVADRNDRVIVGGDFTALGDQSAMYLARLDPDGTLDTTFTTTVNGPVHALARGERLRLLLGGAFTTVDGVENGPLVLLDETGALHTVFDAAGTVTAATFDIAGRVLAAGVDGDGPWFARYDTDGSVETSFTLDGTVRTLTLDLSGRVLVGGSFTSVGGVATGPVARLDGSGFSAVETPVNGSVWALADTSDGLVIGGDFTEFDEVETGPLLRTVAGGIDDSFEAAADETVRTIAVARDGSLLVGGTFTTVNSSIREGLVRLVATAPLTATTVLSAGDLLSADAQEGSRISLRYLPDSGSTDRFSITVDGVNQSIGVYVEDASAVWQARSFDVTLAQGSQRPARVELLGFDGSVVDGVEMVFTSSMGLSVPASVSSESGQVALGVSATTAPTGESVVTGTVDDITVEIPVTVISTAGSVGVSSGTLAAGSTVSVNVAVLDLAGAPFVGAPVRAVFGPVVRGLQVSAGCVTGAVGTCTLSIEAHPETLPGTYPLDVISGSAVEVLLVEVTP